MFVLPRRNRKRLGLLYCPLPPEVFVADDGQFPFPVSGVGVALAYLLLERRGMLRGLRVTNIY